MRQMPQENFMGERANIMEEWIQALRDHDRDLADNKNVDDTVSEDEGLELEHRRAQTMNDLTKEILARPEGHAITSRK